MLNYIFLLFPYSLCVIILKIDKKEKTNDNDKFDFIKDYFNDNNFYTNISIGNPSQIIKSYIRLENFYFYFSSYNIKENYNKTLSLSYKQLNNETSYLANEFSKGNLSSEKFILLNNNENIELNDVNFILATRGSYHSYLQSSGIGLKLNNDKSNFIYQLKNKGIINSYGFTFFFNNNNENKGELIIGGYPHEYNDKYNGRFLRFDKSEISKEIYSWSIYFNKINFGNKVVNEKILSSFTFDYNGFIANQLFHNIIYESLFKSLIENKECFKELSDIDYKLYYYYCNYNSSIKNKFQSIYFHSKNLNYTFIIDKNDVFMYRNNTIYFLILFERDNILNRWILGTPFLKKYQLIFDQDKKVIGFYCKETEQSHLFYLILIFLLFIFIIYLIIFNLKIFLFKKKKISATELEEDFLNNI